MKKPSFQVYCVLEHVAQQKRGGGWMMWRSWTSAINNGWLTERQELTAEGRAVGPDVREVKVGQRYVVSRLQGIEVGGQIVLPESAVLAKAESDLLTKESK